MSEAQDNVFTVLAAVAQGLVGQRMKALSRILDSNTCYKKHDVVVAEAIAEIERLDVRIDEVMEKACTQTL